MPTGYGIGDHRLFLIDLCETDVTGHQRSLVIRPESCKLITRIPGVIKKYNDILDASLIDHRIIERLGRAYRKKLKRKSTQQANKINREATDYATGREKMQEV
jgi:plasmid rolling circle replication initiator protein Rep